MPAGPAPAITTLGCVMRGTYCEIGRVRGCWVHGSLLHAGRAESRTSRHADGSDGARVRRRVVRHLSGDTPTLRRDPRRAGRRARTPHSDRGWEGAAAGPHVWREAVAHVRVSTQRQGGCASRAAMYCIGTARCVSRATLGVMRSAAILLLVGCSAASAPEERGPRVISIGTDAVASVTAHLDTEHVVEADGDAAVLEVDASELLELSHHMHERYGRCGGFMLHDSLADARADVAAMKQIDYTITHGPVVKDTLA